MKVKHFVFNDFQENTYILSDETGECVIIDCGCLYEDEEQKLISYIVDKDLKPVKLLNTHCHIDHVMGNSFIKQEYRIEYLAHEADRFLIESAVQHGAVYGFDVEQPPFPNGYLIDGDIVKFGNSELQVFSVPGHSPGSIVFYNKANAFVLVGDVLFAGSIGRTDLPGGNTNQLITAIQEKLFTLPDETLVYSGHGPTTTIGEEKRTNPFF
ncbi:MAG: MBL fold metallo-hydrolase [Bacteroidales bacterium]|nr:MBL fold metallo-hydrolase [Bacteroidales bacterium]